MWLREHGSATSNQRGWIRADFHQHRSEVVFRTLSKGSYLCTAPNSDLQSTFHSEIYKALTHSCQTHHICHWIESALEFC